ncbi:unnamed protein product [Cochlearia groenlandica]
MNHFAKLQIVDYCLGISRSGSCFPYVLVAIHVCTNCYAQVTVKTDQKNLGYTIESGATCLYNGHVDEDKEEEEESEDVMECLEKISVVCKREIDVMACLDEMKSMKYERYVEKKKKKLDCVKSPLQISSLGVNSKKVAKLPLVLESLCDNYGNDNDDEK